MTESKPDMTKSPFLESFDDVTEVETLEPDAPGEEWTAGHAAGFAEGIATATADQNRLSSELAQTLADLSFTFADAEHALLQRLEPLFSALIEGFLPDIPSRALSGHIQSQLEEAAKADLSRPIIIHLAPSQVDPVGAALASVAGARFALHPDPALNSGEAILSRQTNETAIDLTSLVGAMAEILTSLTVPRTGAHANG